MWFNLKIFHSIVLASQKHFSQTHLLTDFIKMTMCFCPPNSGNKSTFPWKALTFVKKMCFKWPQFQQVQDGRLFLGLLAEFYCSVQLCVGTGCRLYKQYPNYPSYLLEINSSIMFAHLVLDAFHMDTWGLAVHHLNTHPNRKTGVFLCKHSSHFWYISYYLLVVKCSLIQLGSRSLVMWCNYSPPREQQTICK